MGPLRNLRLSFATPGTGVIGFDMGCVDISTFFFAIRKLMPTRSIEVLPRTYLDMQGLSSTSSRPSLLGTFLVDPHYNFSLIGSIS